MRNQDIFEPINTLIVVTVVPAKERTLQESIAPQYVSELEGLSVNIGAGKLCCLQEAQNIPAIKENINK
jgi:hypothetical protein